MGVVLGTEAVNPIRVRKGCHKCIVRHRLELCICEMQHLLALTRILVCRVLESEGQGEATDVRVSELVLLPSWHQ